MKPPRGKRVGSAQAARGTRPGGPGGPEGAGAARVCGALALRPPRRGRSPLLRPSPPGPLPPPAARRDRLRVGKEGPGGEGGPSDAPAPGGLYSAPSLPTSPSRGRGRRTRTPRPPSVLPEGRGPPPPAPRHSRRRCPQGRRAAGRRPGGDRPSSRKGNQRAPGVRGFAGDPPDPS